MDFKKELQVILEQIEEAQKKLGHMVQSEYHKVILNGKINEFTLNQYKLNLARLKDEIVHRTPKYTCNSCRDTGEVQNTNSDDIFGRIFSFLVPCSQCDKGQALRIKKREEEIKAKEVQEKEQELQRQKEKSWRDDIWNPIHDSCWHLLEDFPCQDHIDLNNKIALLESKCFLSEKWVEHDHTFVPNKIDWWARNRRSHFSHAYVKLGLFGGRGEGVYGDRFREYFREKDESGQGRLSFYDIQKLRIPSIFHKEDRLEWVKENVPFALETHEQYYEALSSYPAIYSLWDFYHVCQYYVYGRLPAYFFDTENDYTLIRMREAIKGAIKQVMESL